MHEGPRERGAVIAAETPASETERQRPREEGGRAREQETVKMAQTETDELPVQEPSAETEVRRPHWGPLQSGSRAELGPRAPVWGQGSGPWMGQLGDATWVSWRRLSGLGVLWRPLCPLSPHPASQGQTQGHSRLPRRAYWAARVAFKISLANQIWLFQEAPSLAVPSAGGTSTFQGPWLSTPLWPEQQRTSGIRSPLALGRAWACGWLFGKAAQGEPWASKDTPAAGRWGRTPPCGHGVRPGP